MASFPVLFISHGVGPWSYMSGPLRAGHAQLEASLRELPQRLPDVPKAILLVSAHWEANDFSVMGHARPPMLYDYSGFPASTYQIRYPAPGSPKLAQRVHDLIRAAGLPTHIDRTRGFDHGAYAVLGVTYPDADVPVVEISIRRDFDPAAHLALGQALAPLRAEDVLIIGSGSSYHNFHPVLEESARFDAWLRESLATDADERANRLADWERAPFARAAHPREDHFLPLHVAVGAAGGEASRTIYHEPAFLGQATISNFGFGRFLGAG